MTEKLEHDLLHLTKSLRDLFLYCGESKPNREGLRDTPNRFLKAFIEKTRGYSMKINNLTTFNSEGYDEIIVASNIQFFSMCEHHLESFWGTAYVAYIPKKKILGASKPARVIEMFSCRLQNQERITKQVADYISKQLRIKDIAVILKGKHNCMRCRGVKQANSEFTTSAMYGKFRRAETKTELFELIKLRGDNGQ